MNNFLRIETEMFLLKKSFSIGSPMLRVSAPLMFKGQGETLANLRVTEPEGKDYSNLLPFYFLGK